MNYNKIIWSKLNCISLYSEIINCKTVYLDKTRSIITDDTILNDYSDRTNQLKMTLSEPMINGNILYKGKEYKTVTLKFTTTNLVNKDYDLMLLVNNDNQNIGYIVLPEIHNPSMAIKTFSIKLTIRIVEDIVEASVINSLGNVSHYKSLTDKNFVHHRYRGVSKNLIEKCSTISIKPLLGGLCEQKGTERYFYDLFYKIPLYDKEDRTINYVSIITGQDTDENNINQTYLYEVYTKNNLKHLIRYKLINKSGRAELTSPSSVEKLLENPIPSNITIIPYINGAIFIENNNIKIGYYNDLCKNKLMVNKTYGYRVSDNKIYPNYSQILFTDEELGILEEYLPEYIRYNIHYISYSFIAYSNKNSDDVILRFISFDNDLRVFSDKPGFNKTDQFKEVSFLTLLVSNINKFDLYSPNEDDKFNIFKEQNIKNYLSNYKLSSYDINNKESFTNSSLRNNLVPYSGMWYYLNKVNNNYYLFLL